jgi:hypothetical protein
MAKALLKARSYSAERSAADRKSNTGNVSFSVMDSQNGLSLLDLQIKKKNVSDRVQIRHGNDVDDVSRGGACAT